MRRDVASGKPGSMVWELQAPARALRYRVCCQSFDEHRWDCRDAPREARGVGPLLPVRIVVRCIKFERARFGGAIAAIFNRRVVIDFLAARTS